MRGCSERRRDVYFLMGQIDILRGNVIEGYKLFKVALQYLHPGIDEKRIDFINSFVMAHQDVIDKAMELEKLLELGEHISWDEFNSAIECLKDIDTVDRPYSRMLNLKLSSLYIRDPFEHLDMVNNIFKTSLNDLKITLYFFELTITNQDHVNMVRLRDHVLTLAAKNDQNISTFELVYIYDLVHKTYNLQGKYKLSLDTLDKINKLVPSLPNDYDLNQIRRLIHSHPDETSEDTQDFEN